MKYEKLFEPLKLSKLELRNRVVMGPMGTGFSDGNHILIPNAADYYEERAKGGVGLIICEHIASQQVGLGTPTMGEIYSDEATAGWKKVVDAVHKHGAKIAIEIGHLGRCTTTEYTGGLTPIAPSAVPCHMLQHPVNAATIEDIEQFKQDYLKCVINAKNAGFDAVELHFTNGYFLAQWLSGRTNKRTDEYGGNIEGRLRLPLELVRLIKRHIGPDYPLLARLASREPNGRRDIEETKLIARALEEAGVDILDINVGSFSDFDYEFPPYFHPQGFNLRDVEEIKKSVSIPVIAAGRILEPRMAEQILVEGRADLVQINRGHIADPQWVKKAAADESEGIRRCIGCTRCIQEVLIAGLACSVNPFVGREAEFKITPADTKKKVLVIGGGPAGLQAAIVAAERGHCVTLVERSDMLGGLVKVAAVPPMKWEIASLISSLTYEAKKAGVKILLNTDADISYVKSFKADEVLVATGSAPLIPKIKGIDSDYVVTAVDILNGKAWAGNKVAVIGGGMVGCEIADFLSEYGKKVDIYEMIDQIGADIWTAVKIHMTKRLKTWNVGIYTSAKIDCIKEGILTYTQNGEMQTSEKYDTIVLAAGMKGSNILAEALESAGIKHTVIGDAVNPSRLKEALVSAVEATIKM